MKNKFSKNIVAIATISSVCAFMTIQSFAGTWKEENKEWKYYNDDGKMMHGWVQDNNTWYYLDKITGNLKTSWVEHDKKWYFLNPISDGTMGKMLTGWQWVDGYCYYLNADGSLTVLGKTPDGYRVDSEGKWIDESGKAIFVKDKGIKSRKEEKKIASIASGSKNGSGGSRSGGGSSYGGTIGSSSDSGGQQSDNKVRDTEPKEKKVPEQGNNKPKENTSPGKESNKPENNKPAKKTVSGYVHFEDIKVDYKADKAEYENLIPKKIKLKLSDASEREVDVKSADISKVDTRKEGEYEVSMDYDLPEDIEGEKVVVSVKISVEKPTLVSYKKFEDIKVERNTSYYEDKLPKEIEFTLSNGKIFKTEIKKIEKTGVSIWKVGEYKLKVDYDLPEDIKGEKIEVQLKLIVTPEARFTLEKKEFKASENPMLKFENGNLEEGDVLNIEAGKSEYDEYPKELVEGTHFETDKEGDTVTIKSDELLKKIYASAYINSELKEDKNVYLFITLKKKGQAGIKSYNMTLKYLKNKKEDNKQNPEENLKEAHAGGGVTSSKQRREDLRFPFYHGNFEDLDFTKISEVEFFIEGTNEKLESLKLKKDYTSLDAPEDGYSAILELPFNVVKDKLVDNKVSIYGKGGGYKISTFTIEYWGE